MACLRLAALVAVTVILVACGGSHSATPLPTSICGPVFYQGHGNPNYLIVSDLPLRNPPGARQQVAGIRYELEQHHFSAGKLTIGYQSCDDSTASAGAADQARCAGNMKVYVQNKRVLGVIGPYNSFCAAAEIATANTAPGGPLAMVSTATTYPGLTSAGPGTDVGEPEKYYPDHIRNFVRLTAPDQFQAAAAAMYAHQAQLRRVVVLDDGESYGQEIADWFRRDARQLGVTVVDSESWDQHAKDYRALAAHVAGAAPDAVYLSGLAFLHGTAVAKAVQQAVQGKHVTFLAPDGFANVGEDVHDLGKGANGLLITVAGVAPGDVGAEGKTIVAHTVPQVPEQYGAPYGATAVDVLLDAIAGSNGKRATVTKSLFGTHTPPGILGSFGFDAQGDPTIGAMMLIRIVNGKLTFVGTLRPTESLAKGAVTR